MSGIIKTSTKIYKKQRQSNFELLRIIAIIMIIMCHYYGHGGGSESEKNLILKTIFGCFGCIANNIFLLITGYFLVKSNVNYKKIIKLILEMFFYSIVIDIIFYGFKIVPFDIKNFAKSLLPIIYGNWFCVYYIILYLLIPYINMFVRKIKKEDFRNCLITLIFLISIIPTITNNGWKVENHSLFILSYCLGAYIRLYPIKIFDNNKFNIKILIIILLLCSLGVSTFVLIGKILNIDFFIHNARYFMQGNYSIFNIMMALFIFFIFKNINVKSNLINEIASSVLGIYLIHDNDVIRNWLWNVFFPNAKYINSNLFFLHMIIKVIVIFSTCLIIDKIRIFLMKDFEEKFINKLYEKYYEIKNYYIKLIKNQKSN